MSNRALEAYSDFEIVEELGRRIHEFDEEVEVNIEAGRITWWRHDDEPAKVRDVSFDFFGSNDGPWDEDGALSGTFSAVGIGPTAPGAAMTM